MTPDQTRFINSLSPEKRRQFARMPESQKNAVFSRYISDKGGIRSKGMTVSRNKPRDGLLSYATKKFGNKGISYLNENYGTFEGNLAGSSAAATVSGLSSFLGSGGDVGAGLRSGATTLGREYLRKTADDYITEFARGKGAEAFGEAMGRGDANSAQFAGNTARSNWDTGLSAGVSGGLAGATTLLQTGDTKEAIKAGAVEGAKSALTDYAASYVAQQAYQTAITEGATKAVASSAATSAAASYTPYIGAAVSVGSALLQNGDMTKAQAAQTAMDVGVGAAATSVPVLGWAYGAMKAGLALKGNIKLNRGKNQRIRIGLDADTGKTGVKFDGKMGPDDFNKLKPQTIKKIETIISTKSKRQQQLRDQYISSLPPEQRAEAAWLLQGSLAEFELSGKDINFFNTDEWLNNDNVEDYVSGKHSGMWGKVDIRNVDDMQKRLVRTRAEIKAKGSETADYSGGKSGLAKLDFISDYNKERDINIFPSLTDAKGAWGGDAEEKPMLGSGSRPSEDGKGMYDDKGKYWTNEYLNKHPDINLPVSMEG